MKFYQECEKCKKLTNQGHNAKTYDQFFCDTCFFEVCLDKKFEFGELKPLTLHPRFKNVANLEVKPENWFVNVWEKALNIVRELVNQLGLNIHSHTHG